MRNDFEKVNIKPLFYSKYSNYQHFFINTFDNIWVENKYNDGSTVKNL